MVSLFLYTFIIVKKLSVSITELIKQIVCVLGRFCGNLSKIRNVFHDRLVSDAAIYNFSSGRG
jgi:hypothetical protein